MRRVVAAVDDEGVIGLFYKGNDNVVISSENAKELCEELAQILDLEVVEKHRLKVFGTDGMEPNAKYIGNLLGKQENLEIEDS